MADNFSCIPLTNKSNHLCSYRSFVLNVCKKYHRTLAFSHSSNYSKPCQIHRFLLKGPVLFSSASSSTFGLNCSPPYSLYTSLPSISYFSSVNQYFPILSFYSTTLWTQLPKVYPDNCIGFLYLPSVHTIVYLFAFIIQTTSFCFIVSLLIFLFILLYLSLLSSELEFLFIFLSAIISVIVFSV